MNIKGEEGFITLLEIMIITAILGVLASICVPAYIIARDQNICEREGVDYEEYKENKEILKILEKRQRKQDQEEKIYRKNQPPLYR